MMVNILEPKNKRGPAPLQLLHLHTVCLPMFCVHPPSLVNDRLRA